MLDLAPPLSGLGLAGLLLLILVKSFFSFFPCFLFFCLSEVGLAGLLLLILVKSFFSFFPCLFLVVCLGSGWRDYCSLYWLNPFSLFSLVFFVCLSEVGLARLLLLI